MAAKKFHQKMFSSKKTERIIFATTPKLKSAIEAVAKDQCISTSAFITETIVEGLAKYQNVVDSSNEEK